MAITTTTLASAMGQSDTSIHVTSATGITAPNFQTGSGITVLQIKQEILLVIAAPNGTFVPVLRGQGGSVAITHANGSLVFIGTPADFPNYIEIFGSLMTTFNTISGTIQNATKLTGSADAVVSSIASYNVIMTAGVDAITIPTPIASDEGNIIEFWSATAQAHTVTAASACFAVASASGLRTICTFPAQIGAGIKLRVCNLLYHVIGTGGTGTNSGPVVWT